MNYHSSWNDKAKTYFENIIQAHGGWSAWDKFDNLKFKLNNFKGLLVYAKGLNRSFIAPIEIKVDPKERKTEFVYESHSNYFENGKVIFSAQKKTIENGRELFKKSTFEQWKPEHLIYFFGYAWTNYISYPFILPEFELLSYKIQNGILTQLEIKFPKNFHTHCQVQTFFFNQNNLLQKHNYRAEYA